MENMNNQEILNGSKFDISEYISALKLDNADLTNILKELVKLFWQEKTPSQDNKGNIGTEQEGEIQEEIILEDKAQRERNQYDLRWLFGLSRKPHKNAANLLEVARQDELKARTELASLLRLEQLPADLSLLTIPDMPPSVSYTPEEVVRLALSNSPAYQHQLAELTEARHQEHKARKERGINVGLEVNLGMQQVNNTFGSAFKNQQLYALGSVQFSIPLMDHGAAKKRHEKATAWADRQELASQEVERLLAEDAAVTLQKLQSSSNRLVSTQKTISLAEETYNETAINYANGLCDINTFTLAESRWATAYTNYLAALEEFWVSHYHLQTLINYE